MDPPLAVADARQLNAVVDGHRSMTSYLRAELNYSTTETKRWLQLANVVDVGGSLDLHMAGGDALTAAEMIAIHRAFVEHEYT